MIKLIQGDCLEKMKDIPDGSVDMVFTSPPYNLSNTTGGGLKGKVGKWKNIKLGNGYNNYKDNLPYNDYMEWQKKVINECWRLLSENGAIYYNHKPRVQSGTLQMPTELIPSELKNNIRQIVIWKRAGGINFTQSFYLPTHEWVIIIAKKNFRLKSQAASGAKDIWEVNQENKSLHPAPFPVELPEIAISTTKCETIFDPFMGSGSTGVAAVNFSRNFIGIELDPDYFKIATKRIEAADNQISF